MVWRLSPADVIRREVLRLAAGARGANGIAGNSGSFGHLGATGLAGLAGLLGALGLAGSLGLSIAGSAGLLGAAGAAGATGATGASSVVPIETPLQIAAYGTAVLKRWHRGDDPGTLASGKVASWTNKADSGANPGIGTSPRQPTWLADAGNGLPAVQGLGDNEAGTANRDELRWPGYARPAPGTTANHQFLIWRKDGNEIVANRMIVADSSASTFQLKRPSTTVNDMAIINTSANEMTNANYVQSTVMCTEWLLNNSLESYHKVQGVIAVGSFGGNNAGTAASMFVTQAGTAWMAATVFELIEWWGALNLLQLAKMHAYLADRYSGIVL